MQIKAARNTDPLCNPNHSFSKSFGLHLHSGEKNSSVKIESPKPKILEEKNEIKSSKPIVVDLGAESDYGWDSDTEVQDIPHSKPSVSDSEKVNVQKIPHFVSDSEKVNDFAEQMKTEQVTESNLSSVCSLTTKSFDLEFTEEANNLIDMVPDSNKISVSNSDYIDQCLRINPENLGKSDQGIFLIGSVSEKPVAMLIDTGASCSVMSKKIYDTIPAKHRPNLVNQNCGIKSVSGDVLKCHGVVTINLDFEGTLLPTEFHVADVDDKVILGMSFLSKHGAILDAKAGKILISNKSFPCVILNGQPKPKRVYLTKSYHIPPGQEMVLAGRVKENKCDSNSTVPMLFEPTSTFVRNNGLLVGPTTVMNGQSTIPIRVYNPRDETVTLSPSRDGLRCGYIKPIVVETEIASKEDLVAQVGCNLAATCGGELPEHLHKLFLDSCENLTESEKELVKQKLIQYQDVFSKGESDLGKTNLMTHKIITKDDNPIKQRPRPLPPKQNEEVERQVKLLLESGMISPSESAYSSPIVMVKKKDGSMRMCFDYRKLNDVTIKDAHPLPPINQSIDALSGAKYFCSLDLVSGYMQVPMDPDTKHRSAFCTRSGLYEWNVMSFGLTNAPATFQRLMEKTLSNLHWQICMVYLDDILIYGSSVEQVLDRLEVVLIRLREAGLKLKPKKCNLFRTEVLFLGYKISQNGIHTDPAKIKSVQEFPIPENVNGVRKFLGLTNYYRKFVESYARTAYPLNRLLDNSPKSKDQFNWSEQCQKAFEELRDKLISAPILAMPREEGLFVLDTDSSAEGLGAVLQQEQDGKLVVIAYSSKALSRAERNYCVSRQELLSVVYHIKHFRCYLWGNHFVVRTDHASLRYLMNFKDATGQLARWIDALSEYDFEIQARAGKKNGNADSLSRIPCGGKKCLCDHSCSDPTLDEFYEKPCPLRNLSDRSESHTENNQSRPETLCHLSGTSESKTDTELTPSEPSRQNADISDHSPDEELNCDDISPETLLCYSLYEENEKPQYPFPWTKESMKEAQGNDPVLKHVLIYLEQGVKPTWEQVSHLNNSVKSFLASWNNLEIKDELLYHRNLTSNKNLQLVIPQIYQPKILRNYHDSITAGHLGINKVYSKLQSRYFWPDMKSYVELWIKSCEMCQRKKSPPKSFCAPLQKYVVGVPFERIACDVMGPLNETKAGNSYILVVTDYFSRWVEAYPMPDQQAHTIANVLATEWISRFGCPSEIHTDNGTNFKSKIMESLCKLFEIEQTSTCPRRPQSDGVCERFNHTVQQMLATLVTECIWDWDELLPFCTMSIRSMKHASTSETPNRMIFGRENIFPLEAFAPDTPDHYVYTAPEFIMHIRENIQTSHAKAVEQLQKAVQYQERSYLNRLKPSPYELKDPVWYWRPVVKKGETPKLMTFWTGPYFVIEKLSDVVFRIQKSAKCKSLVVHHNHLKPCVFRESPDTHWLDHAIERHSRKDKETLNIHKTNTKK